MGLKRRNEVVIVDVVPVLDTNAYTANDVMGGLQTIEVCNPGGSGILRHIDIVDADDQKGAGKIHLFNAAPTSIDDDDAFAPVEADLLKRIREIQVYATDYTEWNSLAQAFINDANVDFVTANGNLYFYYTPDGTPTHSADGLRFRFHIWLDQ